VLNLSPNPSPLAERGKVMALTAALVYAPGASRVIPILAFAHAQASDKQR